MIICITSTGNDLEAQLDFRFGRCRYFIFLDNNTGKFDAVENPAVNAMHGAGIQSSQLVLERKPDAVITGNIGPNASSILATAGINVFGGLSGTVKEAASDYITGKLEQLTAPTVPGHFGTSQSDPQGDTSQSRTGGRGHGQGGGRGRNQ
ncbi:MAG: NifB/NifX family molybdenum-iron cluster-binding protein [Elusimicrobiota bacterium]